MHLSFLGFGNGAERYHGEPQNRVKAETRVSGR